MGHECPIVGRVKPAELLAALRRLAGKRGVAFAVRPGKGVHRKVRLGERQTVVPMHARDLGTGLLRAILKQLGLRPEDLE